MCKSKLGTERLVHTQSFYCHLTFRPSLEGAVTSKGTINRFQLLIGKHNKEILPHNRNCMTTLSTFLVVQYLVHELKSAMHNNYCHVNIGHITMAVNYFIVLACIFNNFLPRPTCTPTHELFHRPDAAPASTVEVLNNSR
jgi:hypothetical protein